MSLMKRMLSSIGIGAAKVDTVLTSTSAVAGEPLQAVVNIQGGQVAQRIDEIYFSLHATYEDTVEVTDSEGESEERDVTRVALIDQFKLNDPFTIEAGESREIPLTFRLPPDTPVTLGKTRVWVQTGLDIKRALDPSDRDYLQVQPGRLQAALFDSLHELGFTLVSAECEAASASLRRRLPFIQEFEFKAASGPFQGRLDELEVVCFASDEQLEVLLEIDRKARGLMGLLAEVLDRDESLVRLSLSERDLPELGARLQHLIETHC